MPRDGSGVYSQPFDDVDPDTTIESAVYNGFTRDVEYDLNQPRSIVSGGTGASNATEALQNLGGEKAAAVVTNYYTHVFYPGSFRSAAGATGAPVDGHAFAGICYIAEPLPVSPLPPTNENLVIEVRDVTDVDEDDEDIIPGRMYVREKRDNVWSAWETGDFVKTSGDTMTGNLTIERNADRPRLIFRRSDGDDIGYTTPTYVGSIAMRGVDDHGNKDQLLTEIFTRQLTKDELTCDGQLEFWTAKDAVLSNRMTIGINKIDSTLAFHATGASYTLPAATQDSTVSTQLVNTISGITFNGFLKEDGTAYAAWLAGYVGNMGFDRTTGNMTFYSSTASVAAGVARVTKTNFIFNQSGSIEYRGSRNWSVGDSGFSAFIITDETSSINRLQCSNVGAWTVGTPTSAVSALRLNGAVSQIAHVLDSRSQATTSAGVIGWSLSNTAYGMSGTHHTLPSAAYYSFWGNAGAYISAGTWATSDGRLKSVTSNTDPTLALAAVNALAVKEFKANSPGAQIALRGTDATDETLYGWVAQDVEKIIPIAVRDIQVPWHDMTMRAAVKGVRVPKEDSPEGKKLGKEEITIKAINDRYMLTTLWAAVQKLSVQNDELLAEINALKGVTK